MTEQNILKQDKHYEHYKSDSMDVLGFWLYIITDCILFSTLFAGFVVLRNNTFGGTPIENLVNIPYVFVETMLLLLSSFTFGISILSLYKKSPYKVMGWLMATFLFGLSFVFMELGEFRKMCLEGNTWRSSASLSSFFTLVGTHGLHVSFGLLWMLVMIVQVFIYRRSLHVVEKRLTYLGIFWHFLDIVWIFVFTIVYLLKWR